MFKIRGLKALVFSVRKSDFLNYASYFLYNSLPEIHMPAWKSPLRKKCWVYKKCDCMPIFRNFKHFSSEWHSITWYKHFRWKSVNWICLYNMSQCQLRISKYIRPLFEINKKHAFPRLPSYFTAPKKKLYPLPFGPLFRISTPLQNFKTALYIATVLINKVQRGIVKV
jgi:hypothetical protein